MRASNLVHAQHCAPQEQENKKYCCNHNCEINYIKINNPTYEATKIKAGLI